MTRHRVVLQGSPRTIIVYGYDPAGAGYFLTVIKGARRITEYDALRDDYDGLPGLLRALQVAGVFDVGVMQDALDALVETDVADIEDDAVRAVAEMISNLKQAAGE